MLIRNVVRNGEIEEVAKTGVGSMVTSQFASSTEHIPQR